MAISKNISKNAGTAKAIQSGANVKRQPNSTDKNNRKKTDASVATETARKAALKTEGKTVKLRKTSKSTPLNSDTPIDTGKVEKPKAAKATAPVVNKVISSPMDIGTVVRRATLASILGEMSEDQLNQLERFAIDRRKARTREAGASMAPFAPKHLGRIEIAGMVIQLRDFLSKGLLLDGNEINFNSDTDIRRAIDQIPTLVKPDAANPSLVHVDTTIASLYSICSKFTARIGQEKTVAKLGRVS